MESRTDGWLGLGSLGRRGDGDDRRVVGRVVRGFVERVGGALGPGLSSTGFAWGVLMGPTGLSGLR